MHASYPQTPSDRPQTLRSDRQPIHPPVSAKQELFEHTTISSENSMDNVGIRVGDYSDEALVVNLVHPVVDLLS